MTESASFPFGQLNKDNQEELKRVKRDIKQQQNKAKHLDVAPRRNVNTLAIHVADYEL